MFFFEKTRLLREMSAIFQDLLRLREDFGIWMEKHHMSLTDSQFEKLNQYIQLVKAKNDELNLTRITDNREMWIKHILDSLVGAAFFDIKPGARVIDIGTGGGTPGLPLAILFPSVQFVLVDATQKKINAVEEFARTLNLRNVVCLWARAENLGQNPAHREQYDIVVARALAPLRTLVELAVPLIHLYGKVIAYKGPEYLNELMLATNAVQKLRSEQPRVHQYTLPEDMGQRTIISITKKTVTPTVYPRREGMPTNKPL